MIINRNNLQIPTAELIAIAIKAQLLITDVARLEQKNKLNADFF